MNMAAFLAEHSQATAVAKSRPHHGTARALANRQSLLRREYTRETIFDKNWVRSVKGLKDHTVPVDNEIGFRFSPAHNDIVTAIVGDIFDEKASAVV